MEPTSAPITRLQLEGFKSIRALDLGFGSLNLLIGANGTGKSNLISFFKLLGQMSLGRLQVAVQQAAGASALLYYGPQVTQQVKVELTFFDYGYGCVWAPTADDGLVFTEERVFAQGDSGQQPVTDDLGAGHRETLLTRARLRHARRVLENVQNRMIYHFHDTSETAMVKRTGEIGDDHLLHGNAGNLAAFLFRLRNHYPDHYGLIRDTVRLAAPFFDDFVLRPRPENPNQIRLEWQERHSNYVLQPHHLSDGTLRFMCLTTVLLQPFPPATVLIDEPELGLHPFAIAVLASLMRSAAAATQLIASTQSVTLVNEFAPEQLIIVERHGPESVFKRLAPQQLAGWLEEYSLGELWEKNVLGGRPLP